MKCLIPCSTYSVGKAEAWLNRQAAKGLYLKKWGNIFVTFEKETKMGYQYVIDLDNEKREPDPTRRAENEKAGWSYVTEMPAPCLHVYRARETELPLQPDSVQQNFAARRLRNSLLLTAAVFLIAIVLLIWLESLNPYPFLNIMQKGWSRILRTLMVCILLFACICTDVIPMIRLIWILMKRPDRLHEQKLSKSSGAYGMIWAAELLCLVLLWGLNITGTREKEGENIQTAGETVIFADLSAIEGDGAELLMSSRESDREAARETDQKAAREADQESDQESSRETSMARRLVKSSVPFAKEHYETIQQGYYKYAGEGSQGDYSEKMGAGVSLDGEYWLMSSEKAANRLFDELVERYTQYEWYLWSLFRGYEKTEPGVWTVETISVPGFERLVTAKGAEWNFRRDKTLVFAQTGDWVIYLIYDGKADTGQIIEELCRKFGL